MSSSYPPGYTEPTEEETEYYADLVHKQDQTIREAKTNLITKAKEWCAINAYDSDKGICDEHTIDDCRGRQCNAEELLNYLIQIVKDT